MKQSYKVKKEAPRFFFLIAFGWMIVSAFSIRALAADCPAANGGTRIINLDSSTETTYYPVNVPGGQSGRGKTTAGFLMVRDRTSAFSVRKRSYVINPRVNGVNGKVVLNFFQLKAPDTEITISSKGGTQHTLNKSNFSRYENSTLVLEGEVFVTFEGTVRASSNPKEVIEIRFATGDQVFESCRSRATAVWTSLIKPNSYAIVDDIEYHNDSRAPICMAYFDNNGRFSYGETGFCLNSNRPAGTIRYAYYPGQITFEHKSSSNFDIDDRNGFNQDDLLKSARIVWMLFNADVSSVEKIVSVQSSIWGTLNNSVNHNHSRNSLSGRAQTSVPSLPSPPEPEFLVKSGKEKETVGETINFELKFNVDRNAPRRLRLDIDGGELAGTITGPATLENGFLKFTEVPATINIPVTRESEGKATVRLTYDEEDFWNVHNLEIYHSCNPAIQNFIGLGRKEVTRPYREAAAIWESKALPVTLQSFEARLEGNSSMLSWSTSMETDFDKFRIQRSRDGEAWSELGEVPGAGKGRYSFVDAAPLAGANYYRLAMQDLDGTVDYSPIRSVTGSFAEAPYPNPATDRLNFPVRDANLVSVVNFAGATVFEKRLTDGGIDVGGLAEGVYLAIVKHLDGTVSSHRFLVKR